ncbi:hypothetical protein ACWD4J_04825 [Streptomyces sp. NPDC002577]
MNAFLDYLTVLSLFLLLAAPALVGHAYERRIDRQLRAAERRTATAAPTRRIRRGLTTDHVAKAA